MPELADVEGFRRVLAEHASDKTIDDVDVSDAQVLRGFDQHRIREALCGKRFGSPGRQGKWLTAPILDGWERQPCLLVHFGMTGQLVWDAEATQRHRHDRVVFVLADGELRYRDMRKLKGLYLAENDDSMAELLGDTGPDAAEISREVLIERLTATSRQLKSALSDQTVLAGLGNLLADEILWQARLNPRRRTREISEREFGILHETMASVLARSCRAGNVPTWPSWLTGRRDYRSGSCPRCGAVLRHARVGGRTAVWCPRCQGDGSG